MWRPRCAPSRSRWPSRRPSTSPRQTRWVLGVEGRGGVLSTGHSASVSARRRGTAHCACVSIAVSLLSLPSYHAAAATHPFRTPNSTGALLARRHLRAARLGAAALHGVAPRRRRALRRVCRCAAGGPRAAQLCRWGGEQHGSDPQQEIAKNLQGYIGQPRHLHQLRC